MDARGGKGFPADEETHHGAPSLTPPREKETMTLNEAERNYALMEKLALSLIHMTRRLRRYFEAHPGQVLADFLSEAPEGTKEDLYFWMTEATVEKDEVESWTLFTDRASSQKGKKAGWVNEFPNVLWAHRTLIKQSNRENPFSLTYGREAVTPAEIGIPTYQTLMIREGYNEEEMRLNLDLL
uniref:Reverse transcriptase domain-containing protein n=1 Tax=Tanacetum cinerariifolium TaxID=118510 RepID=A0A6L2NJ87_TANCI|nr:reverse transcriptase domain-containing protein [Tanacetum cinerariifolium]